MFRFQQRRNEDILGRDAGGPGLGQREATIVVAATGLLNVVVVIVRPDLPAKKFFLAGKDLTGQPDMYAGGAGADDGILVKFIQSKIAFDIKQDKLLRMILMVCSCSGGRTIEIVEVRGRHTIFRPEEKDFYFFLQSQTRKRIGCKNCRLYPMGFYKIPYNLIGNFIETRRKKDTQTTTRSSALFEKYAAKGEVSHAILRFQSA